MIQLYLLLTINIILLILIPFVIFIGFSYLDVVFKDRGKIAKKFIDANDGFFRLLFIFAFSVEQALLILAVYAFEYDINMLKLIISFFAVIVIATASLQAFLVETKMKYEKERRGLARRADSYIKSILREAEEKEFLKEE